MRVLVLGGTAFLGHRVATEAVARGHQVTCLARGSSPAPAGCAFSAADRDAEDGLAAVADTDWDVVVDVSRQPGQVRRAVRDLSSDHWVLVSTGNVYADFSRPEQDEGSARRDPLQADVATEADYGPGKVACEDAVLAADGTATVVRSGLIGGPGDDTGRSGYWPWRFAHPSGADVVVPDDPDFPCALIDVRDLASWLVDAGESRLDGVFHATGPTVLLSEVLELAAAVAVSGVPQLPVPVDRLGERGDLGVQPWMGPRSLPLWIDDPDWRCFATMDTSRARAAGLSTRPLRETLAGALSFEETRGGPPACGLSDADEQEIRVALRG